jgi:hypothetical protein
MAIVDLHMMACALPLMVVHISTRIDMANEPNDQPDGIKPPQHNDGPTGRPERVTGAGREATIGDLEQKEHEHEREHQYGYIGKGGAPDSSSEVQ